MTTNISPLRYPGGKTRACKILDKIVNENFDLSKFDTIVSPFFGGGSFEFYLQNKYNKKLIVNDKFKPLYIFWNTCKTNKENLCNELNKNMNVTKEQFNNYRNLIMEETNSLTQAKYYFIINRCSFSGSTLSGGFSEESSKKRFTKSSVERINNLDLSNFEISNSDFKEFIKSNHKTKNKTFLFLDPPYYLEKSNLYGKNGDMHESFDHQELFNCLKKKKNWLLTYNDCTFIRELYKDYTIIECNWSYGMNSSKESSEIIIVK
jgi:DNA adenine methylase